MKAKFPLQIAFEQFGMREIEPVIPSPTHLRDAAQFVKQLLNFGEGVLYKCITAIALNNEGSEKRGSDMKIEVKKIGNSDGLLLPRELMQRLDLKRGQFLHIVELPGGGFQALPYDPDFDRTLEIADEIMDKYRDTLSKLAK